MIKRNASGRYVLEYCASVIKRCIFDMQTQLPEVSDISSTTEIEREWELIGWQ